MSYTRERLWRWIFGLGIGSLILWSVCCDNWTALDALDRLTAQGRGRG